MRKTTTIACMVVGLALWLALPTRVVGQAGTITPTPFQTVFDNSGRTVNNACVWTYTAGTTTPAATYTDVGLTTPNANPIRSDSAGRFTAFLAPATSYKYVYEAACTPPSHGTVYRTADNIGSVPTFATTVDLSATAGETINIGRCAYLSDGGGARTVGQWYNCDYSVAYALPAGRAGVATATISSGTTGTVRIMGLVTGLSGLTTASRYWAGAAGALTTTAPSPSVGLYAKPIGFAASTTSLIVDPVAGVFGNITISDMNIQDSGGAVRFANNGVIKEYATSPEASLTAPAGSLALVIGGGGAGLTGYFKESGAGNVGWLPITTTTASSTLNVVGNFSVNTNKFTVTAASGNTAVAGTLGIAGVVNASDTINLAANSKYLQSYTTGAVQKGLIGINGSNQVLIDGDAIGAKFGGTLALIGTTTLTKADASAALALVSSTGANPVYQTFTNTGGDMYVGSDNSAGTIFSAGGTAYAGAIWMAGNRDLQFGTNNTRRAVLSNAGAWRWHAYGAGALTTDASGNITAVSDERLKDIQGPFSAGLGELAGIHPILFRYKVSSGLDSGNIYAGFGAQNVMATIPEAVGKDLNGTYSINPTPIIAALVTGEQQLMAEIDELRAALKLPKKVRKQLPGMAAAQRIIDSAKAKSGGR